MSEIARILKADTETMENEGVVVKVRSPVFQHKTILITPEDYFIQKGDPPVFTWRELKGIILKSPYKDDNFIRDALRKVYLLKYYFGPSTAEAWGYPKLPDMTGLDTI